MHIICMNLEGEGFKKWAHGKGHVDSKQYLYNMGKVFVDIMKALLLFQSTLNFIHGDAHIGNIVRKRGEDLSRFVMIDLERSISLQDFLPGVKASLLCLDTMSLLSGFFMLCCIDDKTVDKAWMLDNWRQHASIFNFFQLNFCGLLDDSHLDVCLKKDLKSFLKGEDVVDDDNSKLQNLCDKLFPSDSGYDEYEENTMYRVQMYNHIMNNNKCFMLPTSTKPVTILTLNTWVKTHRGPKCEVSVQYSTFN